MSLTAYEKNKVAISFSKSIGRDLNPKNVKKILNTYHRNYKGHLPSKDDLIVDLGCSEGLFMEYLGRQGFHNIVGVDSDTDAIRACRERLKDYQIKNLEVLEQDIKVYLASLKDNTIGCVVMNDVIEHFSKEGLICVLQEIRRVLKKGGIFISKTGNIENPLNIGIYLRDFTHKIAFTKDSLKQCLIICGFDGDRIDIWPIRHGITNLMELAASAAALLVSTFLKLLARVMRMNIYETSKLIYCVARK